MAERVNIIRFGTFEVDATTGELRKHGIRLRLPDQPFRVLMALLDKPKELVTREELHRRVWPEDTFVDFEQGLNRAVNKLREALGDSAANPRFIETLPGRGYRFIGPLEQAEAAMAPPPPPAQKRHFIPLYWTAAALIATVIIASWLFRPAEIQEVRIHKLTTDNYAKFAPVLSDGARLYFRASFEGETFLAQAPVAGGPPTRMALTPPAPFFQLQDLSPDGQELLMTAATSRGGTPALWGLQLADGGARKLREGPVFGAAYSPDGSKILLATVDQIWLSDADGGRAKLLVEAKESRLRQLSWSPDGRSIRWARADPATQKTTAWEMRLGSNPKQLLPDWPDADLVPLGWALAGELGLFESDGAWWARAEPAGPMPRATTALERLALGEPEFRSPVRVRAGRAIYAIGTDRLGEAQHYDSAHGLWSSILDGASAESLHYSPDGARLLYVNYPQRALWVRQADGSRPVQLTNPPLAASFPSWSPDGRQIAFVGRVETGSPGGIYVIDAEGGTPRRVSPAEPVSFSDPAWLPDGRLVFGAQGTVSTRTQAYLRVVDLKSGKVSRIPGSEGLYSARCCSAAGELAAVKWQPIGVPRELVVFDEKQGRITHELAGVPMRFPEWEPAGRWLAYLDGSRLMRWTPGAAVPEPFLAMPVEDTGGFLRAYSFARDGSLLRTLNRDRQQIYSLELVSGRK